MSKRLEILRESLKKKEQKFDERLEAHFGDVRQANGQPLNDKRNGAATMRRWERQNDALRNLEEGIQRTKAAIEREENKVAGVEAAKDYLPPELLRLADAGELEQWRRHPNTFFVRGVEKARIVWDTKRKLLVCRYASYITEEAQYKKFAEVFNRLKRQIQEANGQ